MATKTELDVIWDTAAERSKARRDKRLDPPLVRLWSGDWELRGRLTGEYEAEFEWKLNDTGAGQIVLPFDHHLARWVMRYWERGTSNVHVTCDKDGARWGGRLESCVTEQDEDGTRTVTLNFLHDMEELKHILVWSNPFTPASVQFPRQFILAGPSIYTLKTALFLNLFRIQGNLWRLPDDPLTFNGWLQGLNFREWSILVKPGSLLSDSSQWTVINSRFKTWHDMAKTTLGDGQLYVECRRWLVGDPQPWEGAGLYRNGQLIIDIKDKSGWFGQTSTGGNMVDGLIRSVYQFGESIVDDGRDRSIVVENAPEYELPGFLGSRPKQPWVVYRTDDKVNTAESTSFTWQPATVSQVVVGGKSMPGVNEGISAAVQLTFDALGSFLFNIPAGGAADTLLKPIYEDTILAFMALKSPKRTMDLGWSHYRELFNDGGDQAWTLSALIALRDGFYKTRERTVHSMKVGDGAPYLIGDQGEGHFFLGDRVGGQVPGAPDGSIVVEQVSSLKLTWDAETPHEWEISTGDISAVEDPLAHTIDRIKEITGAIHDLGVV